MTGDPEHFRKFEKLEEKLSSMKVEGCHIELHSENTVCCRTFGGHCIYAVDLLVFFWNAPET